MRKVLLAGAALAAFMGSALGADITPVYKARPSVVTESGYYVWVDGMYERVNLPTYTLGFKAVESLGGGFAGRDIGAVQSFDPRLNGAGVRGAIGYLVPGSSLRLEAGASFVAADASQSQSGTAGSFVGLQFLNGSFANNAFNCVGFVCSVSGTLKTDYTAWQLNGKALYDWRFGGLTVTPSAALFGGSARAKQTLSQSFTQSPVGGAPRSIPVIMRRIRRCAGLTWGRASDWTLPLRSPTPSRSGSAAGSASPSATPRFPEPTSEAPRL